MRLRSVALASLASALILACVPAVSNAARLHAPHHNHGLTIAATPNPIIAGEGVMIYGQLSGSTVSGQTIYLYHRIAPNRLYTLIGKTTTNTDGFYDFTRAEGVVNTNRSWYVTAPDLSGHVHSRTVFERVAAEVSLSASASTADTGQKVDFTGTVTPNHVGQRVYLQTETGVDGTTWKTIKHGVLQSGSTYSIDYAFRSPGDYDVRVLFKGDARNTAAVSAPVTVAVQQAQTADFTIGSSAPVVTYGQSATISGVLYMSGTTTPDPSVSVTLWAHTPGHAFRTVGVPVTTGSDGGYSFTVTPAANTIYQVRTTTTPPARRDTAVLYEGVQDVLSFNVSSTTSEVGQAVTFSGTVSPDKAGHAIYLQRLGADGHWHTVKTGVVSHASTYSIRWRFGHAGTDEFRVLIPTDTRNVGVASAAATITVSLPPVSTLPAGS